VPNGAASQHATPGKASDRPATELLHVRSQQRPEKPSRQKEDVLFLQRQGRLQRCDKDGLHFFGRRPCPRVLRDTS